MYEGGVRVLMIEWVFSNDITEFISMEILLREERV